jgi:glycosyltransferase involved in cell wall biosynthesis
VRFLQFIERFERNGIDVSFDVAPLLEDHCLRRLYDDGARSRGYLLKRYLKRLAVLLTSSDYDLLWIEKELFPGLPALAERLLAAFGVKVIVDYDDAVYAWYSENPSWIMRSLLGRKIDVVCRSADTVVVGNDALATYARAAGAAKVVLIPTVIDTEKYPPPGSQKSSSSEFVVGWIGTPSNVHYLELFKDALTDMASEPGFRLLTIGAPAQLFPGVPQEAHPWSEETEIRLLGNCDCTLAPLGEGAFERGKCGFKVIQGMAAGLPVIASPVGVIKEIIRHGENGFLAETAPECHRLLRMLHAEPSLRRRIGERARETVEQLYSVPVAGTRMAHVLHEALGVAPPITA